MLTAPELRARRHDRIIFSIFQTYRSSMSTDIVHAAVLRWSEGDSSLREITEKEVRLSLKRLVAQSKLVGGPAHFWLPDPPPPAPVARLPAPDPEARADGTAALALRPRPRRVALVIDDGPPIEAPWLLPLLLGLRNTSELAAEALRLFFRKDE
jgi:hypothetical protein